MPLPACVTNVMAVGATDNSDVIANFSNINSEANRINVAPSFQIRIKLDVFVTTSF
ncbi:MAG: hypothetical protein ACM31G_01945 [Flavobacteriales bacterium]